MEIARSAWDQKADSMCDRASSLLEFYTPVSGVFFNYFFHQVYPVLDVVDSMNLWEFNCN